MKKKLTETKEQRKERMLSEAVKVANEVNDGKYGLLKLKDGLSETLVKIKRQVDGSLRRYNDLSVLIHCVSDRIKTPKDSDVVTIVLLDNGEENVTFFLD